MGYSAELHAGYRPAPDAAEQVALFRPLHALDAAVTPVVLVAGLDGVALDWLTAEGLLLPRQAAEAGVSSIGADLAGGDTWGNDAMLDSIDDAITYGGSTYGLRTDRVVLVGISHGSTALGWAWRHPEKVAGFVAGIPAIDLTQMHADNVLGVGDSIEAAYGSEAAWLAAAPDRDPMLNLEACAAFGDRTVMLYGNGDILCLPEKVEAYAAATGATLLERDQGHQLTVADWADLAHWAARFALTA